jgi:hypothetical protein
MPARSTDRPLAEMGLSQLRRAIRSNQVSFPSQVPTFEKHDRPDVQRRLVQLYFVMGRDCHVIGERYGLSRTRVQQILNTWRRRAMATGYLQPLLPKRATCPVDSPQPTDNTEVENRKPGKSARFEIPPRPFMPFSQL